MHLWYHMTCNRMHIVILINRSEIYYVIVIHEKQYVTMLRHMHVCELICMHVNKQKHEMMSDVSCMLPSKATTPLVSMPIPLNLSSTILMLSLWSGRYCSNISALLLLPSLLPVFRGMYGPPSWKLKSHKI